MQTLFNHTKTFFWISLESELWTTQGWLWYQTWQKFSLRHIKLSYCWREMISWNYRIKNFSQEKLSFILKSYLLMVDDLDATASLFDDFWPSFFRDDTMGSVNITPSLASIADVDSSSENSGFLRRPRPSSRSWGKRSRQSPHSVTIRSGMSRPLTPL